MKTSESVVGPVLAQLELVSQQMRAALHTSPTNASAIVGLDTLLRWQTLVEMARMALNGERSGPQCSSTEHHSVPGLDRCWCGSIAMAGMTATSVGGRPSIFAERAPSRAEIGDLVAVVLPPNCSLNLDVDVVRGDAPAAPFIRVVSRWHGLEIEEVDRDA